jgi:ATP-binding cassette subfamily D (ALD) long-chain fatty acid import protein
MQMYKSSRNIKKGTKIDKNLWKLLSAILSKTCGAREATTVFMLSLSLLLRTFGSVWVSHHWGKILRSIVTKNFPRMKVLLTQFGVVTVGLALLNALLKYYIATLKEQVREKVTRYCHEMYMRPKDMIFYKANKVGDEKIENCDHQITSDVDKFSENFASVLSQSLKPIVDFVVYSVELSRVQGLATPLTLYGWFAIASCISTVTLPPFGELAAREQQLEGDFRGAHSTLITNCEQIAFLGGEQPEKNVLNAKLENLLAHLRKSTAMNFHSESLRQYLNKYFVTVIGLILVARPVRLGLNGMGEKTPEEVSQYFVSTWRNMEAMSTSIQDLFELTNRIGRSDVIRHTKVYIHKHIRMCI